MEDKMKETNNKIEYNTAVKSQVLEAALKPVEKVEVDTSNAVAAPVTKRKLVSSNLSASNLNVRKSPNGPVLTVLTPNMECELLDDSMRKEWAKIKVKDNSTIGYVMTRHLKVVKEEVE